MTIAHHVYTGRILKGEGINPGRNKIITIKTKNLRADGTIKIKTPRMFLPSFLMKVTTTVWLFLFHLPDKAITGTACELAPRKSFHRLQQPHRERETRWPLDSRIISRRHLIVSGRANPGWSSLLQRRRQKIARLFSSHTHTHTS